MYLELALCFPLELNTKGEMLSQKIRPVNITGSAKIKLGHIQIILTYSKCLQTCQILVCT